MELTKVKPNCPFLMPKNELSINHFFNFCNLKLGIAPGRVRNDVSMWLAEDHGSGDATVVSVFKENVRVKFFIVAKEDFVLSGLNVMQYVFHEASGGTTKIYSDFQDGQKIKKGDVVLAGVGICAAVLLAERVALNFSARMSGITTKTSKILSEIKKYSNDISLLETRKTTPGLRIYEKYSVRLAGTQNHRHSLDSGIMLKENHLRCIGNIEESIKNCLKNAPVLIKTEIEVTNLEELKAALTSGVDVIMLDNFSVAAAKQAVAEKNSVNEKVKLELSGNLDEKDLSQICSLGVDYISMGALIHKATWVDMSMQVFFDEE